VWGGGRRAFCLPHQLYQKPKTKTKQICQGISKKLNEQYSESQVILNIPILFTKFFRFSYFSI
jgi:hypothetical protein